MLAHMSPVYYIHGMALAMDYGHTKSLILCSPNSNPDPKKYLGCGYKGLVFCRNTGCIMEKMDMGLTFTKMDADSLAENTSNAPEFIALKFWISMKKGFIGRP